VRDKALRAAVALVPYAIVAGLAVVMFFVVDAKLRGHDLLFANKLALILLTGCALLAWVGFHLHVRRSATFSFSRVGDLARTRRGALAWVAGTPRALRIVAVGLVAIALARPYKQKRFVVQSQGIDVMVILDISKSMEERDLDRRHTRLDSAQRTIRRFLRRQGGDDTDSDDRRADRIGLVAFAKQAMLECPLTLDYAALDSIVADVNIGDIDPMGTAIGDALGLATASLTRTKDASSKVVILLTDGDSNVVNEMNPDEAIDAAKAEKVRVFTMLMGRAEGDAIRDPLGRKAYATNPELLQRIASETNGKFFLAPDVDALESGFKEVRATLEKTKKKEFVTRPNELYAALVAPALILLLLEVGLSLTRFRKFP
jgi:Ca-activated chloride channel family protein